MDNRKFFYMGKNLPLDHWTSATTETSSAIVSKPQCIICRFESYVTFFVMQLLLLPLCAG